MSLDCPCGSEQNFDNCCGPLLKGEKKATTAEALMRSRYSAFAKGQVDYILNTHTPESREEISHDETKKWSDESEWLGLEILSTEDGHLDDDVGTVEFLAKYRQGDKEYNHHELAEFEKIDNEWFFTDGKIIQKPLKREGPKVGRNDPCPCGSGKKYKKCCLN